MAEQKTTEAISTEDMKAFFQYAVTGKKPEGYTKERLKRLEKKQVDLKTATVLFKNISQLHLKDYQRMTENTNVLVSAVILALKEQGLITDENIDKSYADVLDEVREMNEEEYEELNDEDVEITEPNSKD